ncbi:MAG: hypothetical protein ACLS6O_00195 [Bifidobacterium sp.]
MYLDVADGDFTVATNGTERTTNRTSALETPAGSSYAKPMPTQRIAWDFVDPRSWRWPRTARCPPP